MKKVNFILIILFLGNYSLLAQESEADKPQENWADYYFINKNYKKVVAYYSTSSDKRSLNDIRNWAIALNELNNKEKAEERYAEITNSNYATVEDYYRYSNLLLKQPKLAKEYREKSVRLSWPSPDLFENDSLLFKKRFEVEAHVINSVVGNSTGSEFGMVFTNQTAPNQVFYLSEQNQSKASKKVLKRIKTDYPIYNFYKASFDKSTFTLSGIEDANSQINSLFQEGPGSLHEESQEFYFTRSSSQWDKQRRVQLNLYQIKLSDLNQNIIPTLLPFNMEEYSTLHPSVNKSGTVLYFASNRPGGYGGMDLYKVFVKDGIFSAPVNLGADINTEADEVFPYSYNDKFLFYSSNAKEGLGEMDVYLAENKFEIRWQKYLLGAGINSSGDDFSFSLNEDLSLGHFSSNREGGEGSDDLYAFDFNPELSGIEDYYQYIPSDTLVVAIDNVLINDELHLTQKDPLQRLIKKEVELTQSPLFGSLNLNKNGSFLYKNTDSNVKKDSFAYKINTAKGVSDEVWVYLDRALVKEEDLPPDLIEAFLPIFYDFADSALLTSYRDRVDEVVAVMQANPDLEVELRSYTDCQGSLDYNLKLSERRNQEIIEYVQKRIQKPERIYGKGYGEDVVASEFNQEYALVAASYSSSSSAERAIKEFESKGYSPILQSFGSNIRVLIKQQETRRAIEKAKKELKAIGIDTWVLVNPCSELSDEAQQQKRRTDFEVIKL
ncbi:MAG: OmpA family protein [Flavobacteriaceae bacterium]|jgi:outer membrane protein OmpA-like peptidoglycan-associated protein|nr:OmpA family protein [Flavobacteriaceae bacterium]MDO7598991.1 OmpA family protein [Flavobacteriaceae bacterium]MDO7603173.1 OmpA family protein [Flavobacteriaceae bacterium]